MKFAITTFSLLLALAGAAQAQQPRPYAYVGLGTVNCSEWTAERAKPGGGDTRLALAWMQGYLTAFNLTHLEPSGNVSDGLNMDQILGQVDIYCRQQPTLPFGWAAQNVLGDMITRKGYQPQGLLTLPSLPTRPLQ